MSRRTRRADPDLGADARRARVLELVRSRLPVDEREAAARRTFLDEVARLATPFDRCSSQVHVTASAIVVGERGTVLLKHRRLGRWLQPGGHVDPGEDPEDAALRECEEETGLGAAHLEGGPRLVHLDVHRAASHVHLDLRYVLAAPDADPMPGPGESQDVRWFAWHEAEAITDDSLAGALRTVRALERSGAIITAAVSGGAADDH